MKNKLAIIRKQRGLTQSQLAEAVGISRPYLSDIETGKYSPGGLIVLKIAKILGVSAEDIFFEDFEDDVNHTEQNSGPDLTSLSTGTLG